MAFSSHKANSQADRLFAFLFFWKGLPNEAKMRLFVYKNAICAIIGLGSSELFFGATRFAPDGLSYC